MVFTVSVTPEQQLLRFSACYRNFSWLENDSTMLFSFTCGICTYELLLGDRKEKKVNTPLMEQIKGVYKMRNFGFMYLLLFNIRIIRRIYSILTKLFSISLRIRESRCWYANCRIHRTRNNYASDWWLARR